MPQDGTNADNIRLRDKWMADPDSVSTADLGKLLEYELAGLEGTAPVGASFQAATGPLISFETMTNKSCPSCHGGGMGALETRGTLDDSTSPGITEHRVIIGLDAVYENLIDLVSLPGYAVDGMNNLPRLLNLIPGVDGFGPMTDRPFLGSEFIRDNLTAGYEGYLALGGAERPVAIDDTDMMIQTGVSYAVNGTAIVLSSGGYAALRLGGAATATAIETTTATGTLLTRTAAAATTPEAVLGSLGTIGFTANNPEDYLKAMASARILWDWSHGRDISIEDLEVAAPEIAEQLQSDSYGGTFTKQQQFSFN